MNEALTGAEKFDFVILQEQSILPVHEKSYAFYYAVRALTEKIRSSGAQPILYATWGRKDGSDTLEEYKFTHESMTWGLAAAYETIGKELNIPVAHVGLAFYDVNTNHGNIELYNKDKSHPSPAGSYLAATVLFEKIFNVKLSDAKFSGDIGKDTASILCHAAESAVFNTPEIPEEYIKASTEASQNTVS